MRDDTANWPLPFRPGEEMTAEGLRFVHRPGLRQHLVSSAALRDVPALHDVPRVHWPDPAPAVPHALVLRRDRLLVVGNWAMPEGWHAAERCAVTDVSGAYDVFELTGAEGLLLLQQMMDISPERPSASVMRRLQGVHVALCVTTSPQDLRLHVPRAQAPAVWQALAVRALAR
jgi:hypothetical protein